ncbi:MAG: hypothetical protein DWQ02_18655 [Bacteroidetes bacterium]|nr:MAG: hypothetical protein DWQ02_18655 [Bacteroidota bacterium]
MSYSKDHTFQLTIRPNSEDIEVRVFDGYNKEVYHDFGYAEIPLTKGYYTVQWQYYGHFQEKVIRLSEDQTVELEAPQIYSAAPIEGAATTHEYYLDPAVQWSKNETAPAIGDNNRLDSKIFVFIRGVDLQRSAALDIIGQFGLFDKQGKEVARLEGGLIQTGPNQSWLAYSVRGSSGQYYLRYYRGIPREIPVFLFRGWQTQIFLTYQKRPIFEGMRIFLASFNEGFIANNQEAVFMDRAIQSISNNLPIPKNQSRFMLSEKVEHPMHGFLWAYGALQRFDYYKDRVRTIEIVIRNLKNSILNDSEAPDIKALQVLFYQKTGGIIDNTPITNLVISEPPMFALGLKAVIDAATEFEDLVPANSYLDQISANLYSDIVWASWEYPMESQEPEEAAIGQERGIWGYEIDPNASTPDWMLSTIAISMEENYQKNKRFNISEEVSVKQLAKSAQIPLSTMQRTVDSIGQSSELQDRMTKIVNDMNLESSADNMMEKLSKLEKK